jgi:sulfopyruvate decarboxylase subunit alpha
MIDVATSADGLYAGLVAGGVSHFIYVPDSAMGLLSGHAERDPAMATIVCAREDEGVAIAAGLFVAGKRSVLTMEASGIGYSGLILARCAIQRTPVLIIASHGGLLGERFDYHGATIASGRGVVNGLETVHGQRTHFVIFVPPHVMTARKGG